MGHLRPADHCEDFGFEGNEQLTREQDFLGETRLGVCGQGWIGETAGDQAEVMMA